MVQRRVDPIDRSSKPDRSPANTTIDKAGSRTPGAAGAAPVRADAMRTLVLVPVLTRARAAGGAGASAPAVPGRAPSLHSPEDRLAEARGLAEAIDLDVVDAALVPVPQPKPGTLFGSGRPARAGG